MKALVIVGLAIALQQAPDVRQPGSPLDHLPPNIEVLTHFGERADISPDNQRVAFMSKSFGDAMVIDLASRAIRCLTCNVPAAVFLRVMHLPSGDYLLIGPDHFEDIHVSRTRDNELWFLAKAPGSKPVKFHEKMSEGVAISKTSTKVAYSQTHDQVPEIPAGASRLVVADVKVAGGVATLENRKTVYESKDRSCTLEAQDFFDHDSKMTATCYEPGGLASIGGVSCPSSSPSSTASETSLKAWTSVGPSPYAFDTSRSSSLITAAPPPFEASSAAVSSPRPTDPGTPA